MDEVAKAAVPGERRKAKERAAADAAVLVLKVDGAPHVLRLREISARMSAEFRAVTGGTLTVQQLLSMDKDDLGLDSMAQLIWLCDRQAGDSPNYDALLDGVTYDTQFEVSHDSADVPPEDPTLPPA